MAKTPYTARQQIADAMRYFNFDRAAKLANAARDTPRMVDCATSIDGKRRKAYSATELRRRARVMLREALQHPDCTIVHQHPLLVVQSGTGSDNPADRMVTLFMVGESY